MLFVWGIFIAVILIFLALDLGIFNRKPHIIKTKEAAIWTSIWVVISLLFSGVIYWLYSTDIVNNVENLSSSNALIKYITGYLIELSLSIDNIFVIAVIFSSFKIPLKYQHRVLFWGILGAIIFRAFMILFGIILIQKFSFTTYIFGAFLIFTAYNMLVSKNEEFHPKKSFIYRQIRRFIPITNQMNNEHFFIKLRHITAATPLFITLIIIEFTDILFALDSIPAILAITADPFLVFTSNIFAILGLRSMYFFLSNMLAKFHHLKYSLMVILTFVGIKLLLVHYYKFHEWVSLSVIGVSLIIGIIVSIISKEKDISTRNECLK